MPQFTRFRIHSKLYEKADQVGWLFTVYESVLRLSVDPSWFALSTGYTNIVEATMTSVLDFVSLKACDCNMHVAGSLYLTPYPVSWSRGLSYIVNA